MGALGHEWGQRNSRSEGGRPLSPYSGLRAGDTGDPWKQQLGGYSWEPSSDFQEDSARCYLFAHFVSEMHEIIFCYYSFLSSGLLAISALNSLSSDCTRQFSM